MVLSLYVVLLLLMDCHALRCKARNDGEKLKIKQVAGGRIFELKTAFFKAHKEIRLEVY